MRTIHMAPGLFVRVRAVSGPFEPITQEMVDVLMRLIAPRMRTQGINLVFADEDGNEPEHHIQLMWTEALHVTSAWVAHQQGTEITATAAGNCIAAVLKSPGRLWRMVNERMVAISTDWMWSIDHDTRWLRSLRTLAFPKGSGREDLREQVHLAYTPSGDPMPTLVLGTPLCHIPVTSVLQVCRPRGPSGPRPPGGRVLVPREVAPHPSRGTRKKNAA